MNEVRFLTLDPGHFHAALVQKEMYPAVSRQVHVYAPLGPDLVAHLERIAGFNGRQDNQTAWELEVHAAEDFCRRAFQERPGNVVVLAGFNARKIDYIQEAVAAGLNVLADKPWILSEAHLPRLEAVLELAQQKDLIAYDIMTERFEITSILQKELVNDREVFGTMVSGNQENPGVTLESVHYLKKTVAGVPLCRPAWFFDIQQQGEGLSDVGTHLVDLVMWVLFPEQAINPAADIQLLAGRRWPTLLTGEDFQQITGRAPFPDFLAGQVLDNRLPYFCNNRLSYTIRGIHVSLDVLWEVQAEPGAGDSLLAVFRGTRAWVEIRQGKEENYRPELYVVPKPEDFSGVKAALERKAAAWQGSFPGVAVEDRGTTIRLLIPDSLRTGHEAHFAQVTRRFLQYLLKKERFPSWENPNMLAKYYVTTRGVELGKP